MRDGQKTAVLVACVFVLLFGTAVLFANKTIDIWNPLDANTESPVVKNTEPISVSVAESYKVTNQKKDKLPSFPLIIFRRNSDIFAINPNDSEVWPITTLPNSVSGNLNRFLLRVLSNQVFIQGRYRPGYKSQSIALSLSNDPVEKTNECLEQAPDGLLYLQRFCSQKSDTGVIIDEHPLMEPHTFTVRPFNVETGIFEKDITISGAMGAAEVRVPIQIDENKYLFQGLAGNRGGFYGMSRIDLSTGKVDDYPRVSSATSFSQIVVAKNGSKAIFLENNDKEYSATSAYCDIFKKDLNLLVLDPKNGNTQNLKIDFASYISNLSISPDGEWYGLHVYDKHPLCRRGDVDKGSWIINRTILSNDQQNVLPGEIIDWIDNNRLLIKNQTEVYGVYTISTDETKWFSEMGQLYFIGVMPDSSKK